jgi:putative endonuclease
LGGRARYEWKRASKAQRGFFPLALYNVDRLVYFEKFSDINQAIARENEIKGTTLRQKIKLIENPEWRDLSHA